MSTEPVKRKLAAILSCGAVGVVMWPVSLAWAQVVPIGAEFQVNTFTTGSQTPLPNRAVSYMADGSFVVVWSGYDGSDLGVFAQRFTALGTRAGTEFRINTDTTGRQSAPVVSGGTGFVVAWLGVVSDGGVGEVFAQRFAANGTRVGSEFQVNSYTTGTQVPYGAATAADGNFVVMWLSRPSPGAPGKPGIFAQRFDSQAEPLGTEFQANTYETGGQNFPAVASAPDGTFLVVWDSVQDGSGRGVFGRMFDGMGMPSGTEFQVNTYTTYDQSLPTVASSGNGRFVVAWTSDQDGSYDGIFGQRIDSAGELIGTEFRVNTYTTYSQRISAVAADRDGGFVVVWEDRSGQDGDGDGVFGQRFDKAGDALGTEFQVNTYTTDSQGFGLEPLASVACDGDGGFVVVWNNFGQDGSYSGVFARRFLTVGPTIGADCGDANGDTAVASVGPSVVITASDALAALMAAVGTRSCDPCVCDVDRSGAVTATDAFVILRHSVDATVELVCPPCD